MNKMKVLGIIIAIISLSGCANAVNTKKFKEIELTKTTQGVSYKKFQIEGCTFIGTQDEEKVWHYAGPITCKKQHTPGTEVVR